MNKYNRYFLIKEGPALEAAKAQDLTNRAALTAYGEIAKELGANEEKFYISENKLVAFIFASPPSSVAFKRVKGGGFYPKQTSKAGKALHERISEVPTVPDRAILEPLGLGTSYSLLDPRKGALYFPALTFLPGEGRPVLYLSVPWFDCDPEELETYKADKAEGARLETNLDAVLWEPLSGWEEVKDWEVNKAIREYNACLK